MAEQDLGDLGLDATQSEHGEADAQESSRSKAARGFVAGGR